MLIRLSTWLDAMRREEGQTLVEYALIIALVSIGALLALGALSGGINGVFDTIVAAF